jgi:hypothetical protein
MARTLPGLPAANAGAPVGTGAKKGVSLMSYATLATMALGVVLAGISGMICYLGGSTVGEVPLDWLPGVGMLLQYPELALGFGGFLIFLGVICQPTRIQ